MFLKNGLQAVKTGKITDTQLRLQFLGDVILSTFALLGSCFSAPPQGKGGTHVAVLSLSAVTGYDVHPAGSSCSLRYLGAGRSQENVSGDNMPSSVPIHCYQVGKRAGDFQPFPYFQEQPESEVVIGI